MEDGGGTGGKDEDSKRYCSTKQQAVENDTYGTLQCLLSEGVQKNVTNCALPRKCSHPKELLAQLPITKHHVKLCEGHGQCCLDNVGNKK